jgi:hypothetical protein
MDEIQLPTEERKKLVDTHLAEVYTWSHDELVEFVTNQLQRDLWQMSDENLTRTKICKKRS